MLLAGALNRTVEVLKVVFAFAADCRRGPLNRTVEVLKVVVPHVGVAAVVGSESDR